MPLVIETATDEELAKLLIMPASQVRSNWSEVLDHIKEDDEAVCVTRFGYPAAIIISYATYWAMKELIMALKRDLDAAMKKPDGCSDNWKEEILMLLEEISLS